MTKLYIKSSEPESIQARDVLLSAGVRCIVKDVLRSHKDRMATPTLVDGSVEYIGLASIARYVLRNGTLDKVSPVCYTVGA